MDSCKPSVCRLNIFSVAQKCWAHLVTDQKWMSFPWCSDRLAVTYHIPPQTLLDMALYQVYLLLWTVYICSTLLHGNPTLVVSGWESESGKSWLYWDQNVINVCLHCSWRHEGCLSESIDCEWWCLVSCAASQQWMVGATACVSHESGSLLHGISWCNNPAEIPEAVMFLGVEKLPCEPSCMRKDFITNSPWIVHFSFLYKRSHQSLASVCEWWQSGLININIHVWFISDSTLTKFTRPPPISTFMHTMTYFSILHLGKHFIGHVGCRVVCNTTENTCADRYCSL